MFFFFGSFISFAFFFFWCCCLFSLIINDCTHPGLDQFLGFDWNHILYDPFTIFNGLSDLCFFTFLFLIIWAVIGFWVLFGTMFCVMLLPFNLDYLLIWLSNDFWVLFEIMFYMILDECKSIFLYFFFMVVFGFYVVNVLFVTLNCWVLVVQFICYMDTSKGDCLETNVFSSIV